MRSLSTLAVALLLASTASATDYYLDASTGSNANPGTSAQPWRTITFALGQPLASGDVLRLRGTFAAPAESFPLSLLPGVSLTTWDSSSTARIDAGTSPCIRIIRPGDHTEEIVGTAGSLVIAGTPAVRIEAPNAAMRCTTRIAGCRIEGRFEVYVAYGHPGYAGDFFHPVVDDCEVVGDMHLFSDSEANGQYDYYMAVTLHRNSISGDLHAENAEATVPLPALTVQDNTILGTLHCIETRGDAGQVHVYGNRILGGGSRALNLDSSLGSSRLMRARVRDNVVPNGGIHVYLPELDSWLEVEGNTCFGDITAISDFWNNINDNVAGGAIVAQCRTFGSQASVSRNRCTTLDILGYGQAGIYVSDNLISGGAMIIRNPMLGASITGNTILNPIGDGMRVMQSAWLATTGVEIRGNTVASSAMSSGAGISLDGQHWQASISENEITMFSYGILIPSSAQIGGHGQGLRLDTNNIRNCGTGMHIDASNATSPVFIEQNTIAGGSSGIHVTRAQLPVAVSIYGNIFAGNSIADVAPGSLLPTDDVRGNLAEDGSLLDFHPSNISGDPHFVDAANGDFRLRPTSPCIAPGNNPAGGDIGRFQSGLQPTLEVVELGGNLASFRTRGESGDHVILFIAAYPARPAALTLCDGLLGLDAPTILAVLPGIITFGRWDLVVDVPPNLAFTAVLQSLRVDLNAPNECSMTNTRFFRR